MHGKQNGLKVFISPCKWFLVPYPSGYVLTFWRDIAWGQMHSLEERLIKIVLFGWVAAISFFVFLFFWYVTKKNWEWVSVRPNKYLVLSFFYELFFLTVFFFCCVALLQLLPHCNAMHWIEWFNSEMMIVWFHLDDCLISSW